jgi:hypothetical protein
LFPGKAANNSKQVTYIQIIENKPVIAIEMPATVAAGILVSGSIIADYRK